MKKLSIIIFFISLQIIGFSVYHYGIRYEMTDYHIGIINLQRVTLEAKAYKHLREFLDKEHTNMRLKIQKLEDEACKDYEKLKKLESDQDPKTMDMRKKLDEKTKHIEKLMNQKKEHLNRFYLAKEKHLNQKTTACIDAIVKKYKLKLIINSNDQQNNPIVIYGDKPMNYTDVMIRMLDREN